MSESFQWIILVVGASWTAYLHGHRAGKRGALCLASVCHCGGNHNDEKECPYGYDEPGIQQSLVESSK